MKNPMELSHVERFDEISPIYLEDLNHTLRLAGGNGLYFYHQKIELIRARLESEPKIIVDFGCAVGLLTQLLAAAFPRAQVIGYDPGKNAIDVAKKNAEGKLPNLSYTHELAALPQGADFVVIAGVFHHIPWAEKAGAARDLARILRGGGKCFLFEHNPWGPMCRLILAFSPLDKGADLQTSKQSMRLLEAAGMQVQERSYISFFPPFLKPLLPLEPYLQGFPLGAQYLVVATKP